MQGEVYRGLGVHARVSVIVDEETKHDRRCKLSVSPLPGVVDAASDVVAVTVTIPLLINWGKLRMQENNAFRYTRLFPEPT